MRGRFLAAPGALLIALAAALWGTDALLRRPLAQSTANTDTVPASRFAATRRVSSADTAIDALWLGRGEGFRGSAASGVDEPSWFPPPPSSFGVIPPDPTSSSPQP